MFFQNLITLILAHTTHFNVLVEDYLSGMMLVAAAALLIWAHRSRSTSTPWIAYVPVAFLMLSAAQWGTTLYGFEIGWALIMLALATALFLLDRPVLHGLSFAVAIIAGMVASFTSLQGLLIWPAGLALIHQRGRPRSQLVTWIASGIAATAIYFVGWNSVTSGNSTSYVWANLIASIRFFFAAIGDVIGLPLTNGSTKSAMLVELLGVAIVVSAIWAVIVFGLRKDDTSGSPIGVSLIWFGLLFAAVTTGGRASMGLSGAGQSRYATFDLLVLVGSYLAIIGRRNASAPVGRHHWLLGGMVVAAVFLQLTVGTYEGISAAHTYRQYELVTAATTANINRAPDGLIESELGAGDQPASFIRQMATFAKGHRLSLFSTAAITGYRRSGLPVDTTPPSVSIGKPMSGAVLRGNQWLVARASSNFGIAKVEFEIAGVGGTRTVVDVATRTPFGWLGGWNTSSVPNGRYILSCRAVDSAGLTSTSAGVAVTVGN
jgi:hypothetical protein